MTRTAIQRVLVPLGVVLMATGYVVLGLSRWYPLFGPDGVDYAVVARNLVEGAGYTLDMVPFHPGLLPTVSHVPEWHGLLRPFELYPLFRLFGVDDSWVRVPSVLYVGSTSIVAFLLGRRFVGALAGYVAALLVLVRWDLVQVAATGLDDAGAAFWTLFTLHCACRASDRPSTRWVLATSLSAAAGTLEKFTGILLPFAVVAAILMHPATRRTVGIRQCLLLLTLPAAAAGLYFLRNYYVYGAFDFRFSALEWLGKGNLPAYFAYYPVRPTTLSVWSELGFGGVINGILFELRALFDMALENAPIMFGGPVALMRLVRRQPLFALAGLFYGAALVLTICVGHEFEPRYVLSLVCIHTVAVAAVVVDAGSNFFLRLESPRAKRFGEMVGLLSIGALLLLSIRTVLRVNVPLDARERQELATRLQNPPSCAGALDFVRQHVGLKSPVLTSDPWFVVWRLHRPAVIAPTNGLDALETVARHYHIEWVLVGPRQFGTRTSDDGRWTLDVGVYMEQMKERKTGLQPLLVAQSDACQVYWLH